MAQDRDKAFEIEDGLIIDNGAAVFSGTAVPSFSANFGDFYLRDDHTIWFNVSSPSPGTTWRLQEASDIVFDPAGTVFVSTNVQDAIEEAQASAIARVESLAVQTQTNTQSNGWVTANGWPLATTSKEADTYIVDWTLNFTNSDKEKAVGTRVQWRSGTSGGWTTIVGSDVRNAVSEDNKFDLRTSFNEITTSVEDVIQFRVQVGQTDNGGTGRVKNMVIKLTRKVS